MLLNSTSKQDNVFVADEVCRWKAEVIQVKTHATSNSLKCTLETKFPQSLMFFFQPIELVYRLNMQYEKERSFAMVFFCHLQTSQLH